MKQLLSLVLFVCMSAGLYAQQAMPVILVSSSGKVRYISPDQKGKQKVITGAVMKRQGQLKLPKNGSVTMFCNGNFIHKRGKQIFNLVDLFPLDGGVVKVNFDLEFGDFTTAAFMMAAGATDKRDGWGGINDPTRTGDGWGGINDPTRTGDGWGGINDPTRTGDGWGGRGLNIVAIQPLGRVLPESTRFYWSTPKGSPSYHLEIRDDAEKLVMEHTTTDSFWTVDLKNAAFKPGVTYTWTATSIGDNAIASNGLRFEIGTLAQRAEAMKEAEEGELMEKSTEEIRAVMQAVALEREGWYEEAARIYQKTQDAHPKNEYVKLMHAAFWMRCGLKPKARAVYN